MSHDPSNPGTPGRPPGPGELEKEFIYSLLKIWDKAIPIPDLPIDPNPPGPRECPDDLEEMCRKLHKWARAWKIWGDLVHDRLWPEGPTDPPDPPPDSPFV